MVEVILKVRAVGGSLMATIPKNVVSFLGLSEGHLVKMDIRKAKNSFFGSVKGLKGFSKADGFDVE